MRHHAIFHLRNLDAPHFLTSKGFLMTEELSLIYDARRGNGVCLPPVCCDFLILPSREIVGVTVGLRDDELPLIRSLFRNSRPERVSIKERSHLPSRYAAYPDWNWLEVTWMDATQALLMEAQSSQVLWHIGQGEPLEIVVLVLEDLDFIQTEEVDGVFLWPLPPESPSQ